MDQQAAEATAGVCGAEGEPTNLRSASSEGAVAQGGRPGPGRVPRAQGPSTATHILAVALLAASAACGGSDALLTGEQVEARTASWVREHGGRPIDRVDCPPRNLADGDSVVCQILFPDGSFVGVKVTVAGEPGRVRLYQELAR